MKTVYRILTISTLFMSSLFPQSTYTLMDYNLLNYPGSNSSTRNPYFKQTLTYTQPDILVVEEINSQAGVNEFLNNVLIPVNSDYASGTFIDGPDTDSEIFFKSSLFTFISNTAISTELRNIYEFKIYNNQTLDTLIIFSVHLKASSGTDNEQKRALEVNNLRQVTNALPPGSNFIVCGDFNIYGSGEPAYQALLNQDFPGYFIDPFVLSGTWNNAAYASYHTQSTRTRAFGGGATGGLDDRFDMILYSQAVSDPGGIRYIDSLFTVLGNDGNHYNDSINQPPNTAVPQYIADALEFSSDHLPVIAAFIFGDGLPVELTSFKASANINSVSLNWTTSTETNNSGFEIQRKFNNDKFKSIGFVKGSGTSTKQNLYSYNDENLQPGEYQYLLKQVDFDGTASFSKTVRVDVSPVNGFELSQNYPNPFNPATTIKYKVPLKSFVTMKVYDILGNEIATLINEEKPAGSYEVKFNASSITSGIYFYKLTLGSFTQVKKMILLK